MLLYLQFFIKVKLHPANLQVCRELLKTLIMARYNKLLSAFVIVYWPVCTPSLFPTDGDGEN